MWLGLINKLLKEEQNWIFWMLNVSSVTIQIWMFECFHYVYFHYCVHVLHFCLPSCIEVRAWLTVCWLERRQFFSWAAADCGDEAGLTLLTELAEFTSGVEGRDEEGPGDPGDAGSEILFPTWLHPLPPPPPTGLDKHEPREAPAPNGALQRGEERDIDLSLIVSND